METSKRFYRAVLDSLPEQLTVINSKGRIIYVNNSWQEFGNENDCNCCSSWLDQNYIATCEKAAQLGDCDAREVVKGLKAIFYSDSQSFYYEYPCHSPAEQRWFIMRAVPLCLDGATLIVITHQNITARKLAEEKAEELAVQDALTGLANRRKFNEHLVQQWRESAREQQCLALAFIDIDYFKLINDAYGHAVGDRVLIQLADILKTYARRASDLCARYGGEEFVLLLRDLELKEAIVIIEKMQQQIRTKNFFSGVLEHFQKVTVSVGLVETSPVAGADVFALIDSADKLLYQAKNSGRDQVSYSKVTFSPDNLGQIAHQP